MHVSLVLWPLDAKKSGIKLMKTVRDTEDLREGVR